MLKIGIIHFAKSRVAKMILLCSLQKEGGKK